MDSEQRARMGACPIAVLNPRVRSHEQSADAPSRCGANRYWQNAVAGGNGTNRCRGGHRPLARTGVGTSRLGEGVRGTPDHHLYHTLPDAIRDTGTGSREPGSAVRHL